MSNSGMKLGMCDVCNAQPAKYTCPRCEVKTCCLPCVNIHKKELDCDGKRNRTAYKPLSQFTYSDLQNDYKFLDEITQSVENYAKESKHYMGKYNRNLPMHLNKLRLASTKRGTRLLLLPRTFSRRTQNSTYLDWKKDVIWWKINWIFPQANNILYFDERCPENERLSVLASQYMDPNRCPNVLREHLKFYHSASLSGVSLLLKAENIRRASSLYYELAPDSTLKRNLKGKTIIEHPTIHLVLNNHKDIYEIIDSDEEPVEEDKYQQNGPMSRKHGHISSKNLLFYNCDSSDGVSDDDSRKRPRESNTEPIKSTAKTTDVSFPPYRVPKHIINEGASTSYKVSELDIPPN